MIATERIAGLDTLRGLGILLVVMSHSGFYGDWMLYASIIHVPIFYLVAGYLFKDEATYGEMLSEKLRRIVVPYLFYSLLGLGVYVVGNCLLLHKPFDGGHFDVLSAERYQLPYIASLWFFESIFWCFVIFGLVRRAVADQRLVAAIVLLLGIVGWTLSRTASLPLSIDTSLSWLPLFYVGNLLRRIGVGSRLLQGKYAIAGAVTAIAGAILYVAAGCRPGYCYNVILGNVLLNVVLTMAVTLGMLALCCRVGRVPLLSFLGRNTLTIFAGHQVVGIMFVCGLKSIGVEVDGGVMPWLIVLVTIAGALAIGWIVRKVAPVLIGER